MSAIDVVRSLDHNLLATGEQSIDVVGLFRDPRTSADLPRRLTLRDPPLGFTQEADDLLSRLPLPCHLHISSGDFGNSRIRSSHLVPDRGSRPAVFTLRRMLARTSSHMLRSAHARLRKSDFESHCTIS